jgi:hypothetical protein
MAAEHPIIFTAESIHALIRRGKFQTRRLIKWPEVDEPEEDTWIQDGWPYYRSDNELGAQDETPLSCPYGEPGHKLWVREGYSLDGLGCYPCPPCWYRADFESYDDPAKGHHVGVEQGDRCKVGPAQCLACTPGGFRWKSPIFMPKHHARIWLKVTGIRAEPLQNITDADAILEGAIRTKLPMADTIVYSMVPYPTDLVASTPVDAYRFGWDAINGKRAPWKDNPSVWVITFEPVRLA